MGAEEPSPCGLRVKQSCGLEVGVDVLNSALVTCDLIVKLADMVLEAPNPVNLLRVVVTSFFLMLTDEFHKVLHKVTKFCHAKSRDCRADHADDGWSEGA